MKASYDDKQGDLGSNVNDHASMREQLAEAKHSLLGARRQHLLFQHREDVWGAVCDCDQRLQQQEPHEEQNEPHAQMAQMGLLAGFLQIKFGAIAPNVLLNCSFSFRVSSTS